MTFESLPDSIKGVLNDDFVAFWEAWLTYYEILSYYDIPDSLQNRQGHIDLIYKLSSFMTIKEIWVPNFYRLFENFWTYDEVYNQLEYVVKKLWLRGGNVEFYLFNDSWKVPDILSFMQKYPYIDYDLYFKSSGNFSEKYQEKMKCTQEEIYELSNEVNKLLWSQYAFYLLENNSLDDIKRVKEYFPWASSSVVWWILKSSESDLSKWKDFFDKYNFVWDQRRNGELEYMFSRDVLWENFSIQDFEVSFQRILEFERFSDEKNLALSPSELVSWSSYGIKISQLEDCHNAGIDVGKHFYKMVEVKSHWSDESIPFVQRVESVVGFVDFFSLKSIEPISILILGSYE